MSQDKCPICGEPVYYEEQSDHRGKRGLRVPKNASNGEDHLKTCKK
jgi:hypothetical protein